MHVVNRLDAARAALASGERALVSPPFAACYAGVNYYRAMLDALRIEFPDADFSFTLCCGDDAAIAHDALRMGFTSIICDCGEAQLRALQAMAAMMDAVVQRTT